MDAAPPLSVREAFWLPTNSPIVGCIGALVDHKGHRHLVHAATDIVRAVPDARVVILGEGELRGDLTRLIHDLGLERHVLLPGFRPDVLSLLKTFDVFVMPSITEGLGTSILDAMACAKAVVASAVGGIPEVVEPEVTGLLVPPRDPGTLGAAVVRLLRDPALARRLGEAGRVRVEQRFSAERMGLSKRQRIGGRYSAEFRVEAFNLLNTPIFDFVDTDINSTTFGRVLQLEPNATASRVVQLAVKFNF